jgi:hypothetical protein
MAKVGRSVSRRRSRGEWQELLEQWHRSGQSVGVFCAERDLRVSTFSWWRWRLGSDEASDSEPEPPISADAESWLRWTAPASVPAGEEGVAFELRWPDGLSLRVPQGFDPTALARLLSVLETSGC